MRLADVRQLDLSIHCRSDRRRTILRFIADVETYDQLVKPHRFKSNRLPIDNQLVSRLINCFSVTPARKDMLVIFHITKFRQLDAISCGAHNRFRQRPDNRLVRSKIDIRGKRELHIRHPCAVLAGIDQVIIIIFVVNPRDRVCPGRSHRHNHTLPVRHTIQQGNLFSVEQANSIIQ